MSVFPQIFTNFISQNTQNFPNPDISLEQYPTPVSVLEKIFSKSFDFNNKRVLDLGVGLGSISFSTAWLGAYIVVGIDADRKIIQTLHQNEKIFLELYNNSKVKSNINNRKNQGLTTTSFFPAFSWIHSQIEYFPFERFNRYFDYIVMNPPFGTQRKGIDFVFLQRAMLLNCPILSLHKDSPGFDERVEHLLNEKNYFLDSIELISFPLGYSMNHHRKKIHEINSKLIVAIPENDEIS